MNLSFKVRFLNFFRNVFRIPFLERALASLTVSKSPRHIVSKFVPNHYQYPPGSERSFVRQGIMMKVDICDYLGHSIYFGFRDESLDALLSLCKAGFHVIDVGANLGWSVLNLAKISNTGTILGFEPDPLNFQKLTENVSANHMTNIVLLSVGLGDKSHTARMEVRTPLNRGGNRIAPSNSNAYSIEIVTLDSSQEVSRLPRVDLIKIDVEGYELKVLRGSREVLKKFKPILFIELDQNNLKDQGDTPSALIEYLIELGYVSFTSAETRMNISANTDFTGCHFDLIAK